MAMTIMTPAEARLAREHVGLSQAKVARATGISRTKLALFEVEKYLLDDATLTALRAYYEDGGYRFKPVEEGQAMDTPHCADGPTGRVDAMGFRLVDGFAVPAGIGSDEAEELLAELNKNDARIEALASESAKVDWWSDVPDKEGRDEIVRLMARNYLLTRRLQGDAVFGTASRSNGETPTHGTLAVALIGG